MNENYPLKHLPPLKGEVAATAVGGVLQKSDESFDKATADFVNPSVCVPQTSFSPKTGTPLSASLTFPLTGESPFRGDKGWWRSVCS